MQYEVTIGIPLYKAFGYIEQTMLSALNQTLPNIEFLVIDDCGDDGSVQVVEQLQDSHPRGKDIHILYHNQNMGVGITRNRILDEAKGNYLYFLDSDDLIESNTIQLLVEKSKEYQADVVYSSLDRIDTINNSPTQLMRLQNVRLLNDEMAFYAFRNYSSFQVSVCNCLMNLEFLRSHHLRFIDRMFWEDLAFTYEMVTKVKSAVLLSDITYHYLCRPGSLSHYQDREQMEKEEILKNVSTIDYLKEMCKKLKGKSYLPYLCNNLGTNSFYIVCYILKHHHRIVPSISYEEMHKALSYPLSFYSIVCFKHCILKNMLWRILDSLSPFFSILCVKLINKLKSLCTIFKFL